MSKMNNLEIIIKLDTQICYQNTFFSVLQQTDIVLLKQKEKQRSFRQWKVHQKNNLSSNLIVQIWKIADNKLWKELYNHITQTHKTQCKLSAEVKTRMNI